MKLPQNTFRIALIIVWVILFGAILKRDYFIKSIDVREAQILKRGREESFAGIYFKNERIGFVKNRLAESAADEFTLFQDAFLSLNILNESHPVDMRLKATLTGDMLLKDFVFHFTSPFYKMAAEGRVDGRTVSFSLTTGKETISDSIQLQKQPFLSTSNRAYLLKQELQPGDKLKIPYFDPLSLSGKDTVVVYKGRKKVLINNRIYNLHHFVETFSGVKINSWLNDEGKVIKEESPAGFVFVSEPEFKARDIKLKGKEMLSSVSVPITGKLPDLIGRSYMRYKLTLPADTDFNLDKDRQGFAGDTLTLHLESLPGPDASACNGYPEELASTPYIQTKNPRITDLAHEITDEKTSPLNKVKDLADWIFENLEKRPVLGIPDALTTLNTRMGDCNEHAALFAALARNVGIPTRVAAGVTFFEGAFYYHAWNEVCLDDTWYSVDTTKNQFPADLSHIKFVEGGTDKMIRIAALLGKLKIEVLDDLETN